MKYKTIMSAIMLCCTLTLIAQTDIRKSIKDIQSKHIKMDFNFADVKISSWDKNEIAIKGKATINGGQNDQDFTIDIEERSNEVQIETFVKNYERLSKKEKRPLKRKLPELAI